VQRPGQKLITLTTCAELFHTDNRMIAFGHLVDTAPR
jgi:sortase A